MAATADDAPYTTVGLATGPVGEVLLARSPAYGPDGAPVQPVAVEQNYVGRLQPAMGFSEGNYALNTADDAGTPNGSAGVNLPGIRAGGFAFSRRLLAQGDQGVIDNLLSERQTYIDVDQAPWTESDRPAGR